MKGALTAAAVLLLSGSAFAQVRDRAAAATGTASVSGTVTSETQPPRPVRRASVTVNCSDPVVGRTAITDDAGRFAIDGLPAGRYTVNATKRGWNPASFGAKAVGRPGRSLAVADGERATAALRMSRASVITGTVLDPGGLPPSGVTIRVLRYAYAFNTGERRLTATAASFSGPDDRGTYRVWGLQPGEYYVSAYASSEGPAGGERDIHLTSETDVQEALRAAQSPSAPAADVPQPAVGLAPLYYPGALNVAQATPITLRAAEERTGIDFTVQYVRTAHVEGTVSGPEGTPPAVTMIDLITNDPTMSTFGFDAMRSTRASNDGRFDFSSVMPGSYTLAARTTFPGSAPSGGTTSLSAVTQLDVQGEDVRGLSLVLQEGLTISGVVRADGTAKPPVFSAMRINLSPVQGSSGISILSTTNSIDAEGRFRITGVAPGRYRLLTSAPGPQPAWTLRSSTIGGQDALEAPADIRQSTDTAVITLTDRPAELTGRVEPNTGDVTVVLFSANQAHWVPPSRKILATRASSDGSFAFKNVPIGDYMLTALEDVETSEWFDPAFLQRAMPAATRITIAEGDKKVQNLRIGGG